MFADKIGRAKCRNRAPTAAISENRSQGAFIYKRWRMQGASTKEIVMLRISSNELGETLRKQAGMRKVREIIINELQPTQITVGMIEVEEKQHHIAKMMRDHPHRLAQYISDH